MINNSFPLLSRLQLIALLVAIVLPTTTAGSEFRFAWFDPFSNDQPMSEVDPLIQSSEAAVTKAVGIVSRLDEIKKQIERLKNKSKADLETAGLIIEVRTFLEKDNELQEALKAATSSVADLSDFETKLTALNDRIPAAPTNPEVTAAKKKLTDQKARVSGQKTNVNKSKDGLSEPTNEAFKVLAALAGDLKKQLEQVNAQNDDVKELLKTLPTQLAQFNNIVEVFQSFEANFTVLTTQLKRIVTTPTTDPATALADSRNSITRTTAKVVGWTGTLVSRLEDISTELINMRLKLDVKDGVARDGVSAMKLVDEAELMVRPIESILATGKRTSELLKDQEIKANIGLIDERLTKHNNNLELVREGLSGDYKNFINDFVPLYYFTDVPGLMRMINPATREVRSASALREEAAARRRALERADLDLASAAETVNSLQVKKRNLEDELRDAENKFKSASDLLSQATRRLSRFAADDPKRRAFQEQVDDRTKQKTEAETRYNDVKNAETGLPKQIEAAEKELLAAQKAVREARNNMITLTQTESEAFAAARDNEPIYFAGNEAASKDPVKQVIIYAFGNRKIVYLRGTEDNVARVKNMISFFDRPAPQARLALWTIELNGPDGVKASREFSEKLEFVDNRLSDTRAQIAVVLSRLRRLLYEKVNEVAAEKICRSNCSPRDGLVNGSDYDLQRWARTFFYAKAVRSRLGFDEKDPRIKGSGEQAKIIARNTLPDPINAGTLGEIMVTLALAEPAYRDEVLASLGGDKADPTSLQSELDAVIPDSAKKKSDGQVANPPEKWFELTKRALDFDNCHNGKDRCQKNQAFSPVQKEIVNSITLASVPRLIARLKGFAGLGKCQSLDNQLKENSDARKNLSREIASVIDFIWYSYGVSSTDLFGYDVEPDEGAEILIDDLVAKSGTEKKTRIAEMIEKVNAINQSQNIFRLANAQIARTDNLIKQLIDAFDEDINRNIVNRAVYGLRDDLLKNKVSLGIINRTSVLATNRLAARVEARNSAQLAVGEEKDALLAAQQLVNIYLAAKTGGLLGGLTGLQNTKQEQDVSEIYGINGGGLFKVTPFFDPSGQALRFQFDHTQANFVTEPDGSITPARPRIERHSVNTEVQLSNLELREISRFEANSRVGIPTIYKGGIPIFRDIPGVNKVPLLGWFTRRSGRSAMIQQSLILGQTTMYPTIADMFGLLTGDDYKIMSEELNKSQSAKTTPTPCPPIP